MAKKIDTVQRGQAITAEAWNALIERINQLERDKFSMTLPTRMPKAMLAARPMLLATNWLKQDNETMWRATAYFIDSSTGEADTSGTVDVVAPTYTENKPAGEANKWKFWAVWRKGRWETMQETVETSDLSFNVYTDNDYLVISIE